MEFFETDVYPDDEIIEHSKSCDYIFVIWGKKVGGFPFQSITYLIGLIEEIG